MNARKGAVLASAGLVALGWTITPTEASTAATRVSSGSGWVLSAQGAYLGAEGWQIQWADTTVRTKAASRVILVSKNLATITGIPITVTSKIAPADECPNDRTIVIRMHYGSTRSNATQCYMGDRVASSLISLSRWSWDNRALWGSRETYKRNVLAHEMGHSFGLGHPDEATGKSCSALGDPLMCGITWGGYRDWYHAGQWKAPDVRGLKALVANRNKVK